MPIICIYIDSTDFVAASEKLYCSQIPFQHVIERYSLYIDVTSNKKGKKEKIEIVMKIP